MLTVGVRIKLVAFLLIGVAVTVYIGLRYADLGRFVGVPGYYVVKLDLADSGGIFTNAEVTYRGVTVGRVGPLNLTATGIEVDLNIDDSAPPIPATVTAAVTDRSAVGEQYVDLRPKTDGAPYLVAGSTIAQRDTELPPRVQTVLGNLDSLASSVPLPDLRTVVNQLYDATAGQGENLQTLLDAGNALTTKATDDLPNTVQLVQDSQTVLTTQADESAALATFGSQAELLAHQLAKSDGDVRRLIGDTGPAATQINGLLADTSPQLGTLLANLLTTSDVLVTRQGALTEALSVTPAALAAGSSVITPNGATFGMALTFFSPLPCVTGYGTTERNGLTVTPSPPLNTNARCTLPPSSGVEVRGSANAPSGGGVPPAAK
jgi:phospholipid/cholesterol/gamma-HCH transport system substrate-binding protein